MGVVGLLNLRCSECGDHTSPFWCSSAPWQIQPLKFNIAFEHVLSQKESSLPTIIFQKLWAMLNFGGCTGKSWKPFLVIQDKLKQQYDTIWYGCQQSDFGLRMYYNILFGLDFLKKLCRSWQDAERRKPILGQGISLQKIFECGNPLQKGPHRIKVKVIQSLIAVASPRWF